ncbi:glycine zipper family protein [Gluconacetobacter diazotrophicus]|uniref:Glycine zipper family protein n=1 Tax=Gluconacetobacter diazotrophicus TaxID=33996 RepID=A0A7W4NIU0_GLUDI|nr:glycine zipper family protein [Gluconacetobacter diazotrophicus]MBB2158531.1 glycine zipper family protein [Gluconacetobacter diazotrophicus]
MMFKRNLVVASLAALALQGCAETPSGPTVQVMPPPTKPFEIFQADDRLCRNFAASQVAGQAEHANNRALAAGLIGTALGAGLGAAAGGGYGAGIGAGGGAIAGTAVGSSGSAGAQGGIQGQYDTAYAQCMYSKGNIVPGVTPPPPPPGAYGPPPGPAPYPTAPQQLQ